MEIVKDKISVKKLEEWKKLSICQQMANVGYEVKKVIMWKNKNSESNIKISLGVAMRLLDLTVRDPKNKIRVIEILKVKEALIDYFLGENQYSSSDENWNKYFSFFNYATSR